MVQPPLGGVAPARRGGPDAMAPARRCSPSSTVQPLLDGAAYLRGLNGLLPLTSPEFETTFARPFPIHVLLRLLTMLARRSGSCDTP